MMTALTDWLRQVVAAAFFSAALAALLPTGAIKRITMLCCSFLLLLTLFRPLLGERLEEQMEHSLATMEQNLLDAAQQTEQTHQQQWERLIAEELVSYIETTAAQEGVSCTALVTLRCDEDGVPLPSSVELRASQYSETVQRRLCEELGVAEEDIQWRIG